MAATLLEPWDPLDHPPLIQVRKQESDSEEEGGLGNVTRVVIRPPGHSGKAKRGHLSFDASFEGGNLGRVDFISEFEYDLFIRPDTANPRVRFWFNFVVDNVRAGQTVVFNIVNIHKARSLWATGLTPLVRTSSRPRWTRLPSDYVFYHRSPEHRLHYVLSFAFQFDRESDVFQFATCFPYSAARAEAHLAGLLRRSLPFVRHQTLAFSLQRRRVNLLTIGGNPGGTEAAPIAAPTPTPAPAPRGAGRTKVVVVLGRVHPGETPSSFVVQGLLDFLCSSHGVAVALRDAVVIEVVPIVNPDGVFMGNHRSSLLGQDLNRHWGAPSPHAHPTLTALRGHLLSLAGGKGGVGGLELDLVVDVHASTALLGAFVVGSSYDDVYRFERHILFPKLLAHNAPDYTPSQTMYNRDPAKSGTARRALCELLPPAVNVYSLHVSMLGYTQPRTGTLVPYTEEAYFRLGRNLARTFFDYYKATGVISASVVVPIEAPPVSHALPGRTRNNDRGSGRAADVEARKKKEKKKARREARAKIERSHNGDGGPDEDGRRSLHLAPLSDVPPFGSISSASLSSTTAGSEADDDDDELSVNSRPHHRREYEAVHSPTTDTLLNPDAASTSPPGTSRDSGRSHKHSRRYVHSPPPTLDDSPAPAPRPSLRFARAIGADRLQKVPTKCKTFDFSVLTPIGQETRKGRGGKRSFMERRREARLRARRAAAAAATSTTRKAAAGATEFGHYRKIGGGGIVARSRRKGRDGVSRAPRVRLEEGPPVLTVIDLGVGSMLRLSLHLDARQWRRRRMSGVRMRDAAAERLRNRRRRAGLLREYVTDVSAWEDGDDEEEKERQRERRKSPNNVDEMSDGDGYYSAPPATIARTESGGGADTVGDTTTDADDGDS